MNQSVSLLYRLADAIPQRPALRIRAIKAHAADQQKAAIRWAALSFTLDQAGDPDAAQASIVADACRRTAAELRAAAARLE